ncbi:hypothetical protein BT96DRAFT_624054 [Gymnopus androsaceus JB14]|uniref:Uncharacterized protein n=1 Tax=Gymnopus androsaceus JB14 TaxID=1447944 RepID=A0A6A4IGG5_9AGAR|nr:hypothetical protein BT96DRAFT_624054 [Gymnopus androsaceus JB14]
MDDSPDDNALETLVVGTVRQVKPWLRGRYADVSVENINKADSFLSFTKPKLFKTSQIFQLLDPALNPTDTITGAQFFAVLRLVIHVENGSTVDSSFAFVQCASYNIAVGD